MTSPQSLKYHHRKRLRLNSQLLFALLLLINLLPIFAAEYFLSGDGPSHLYNAKLILQLLTDEQSLAHRFFHLRWELIPNLGGHILLALFSAVTPASLAEKLVFALALGGTAIGFRYLLKGMQRGVIWGSFLIFPLLHHFSFYIGFQSFCLALALMLFSLGYFVRHRHHAKLPQLIILALLLLVTALFHLFPALICFLLMALWQARELKHQPARLLPLLLSSAPALLLCAYFLFQNHGSDAAQWSDPLQLLMDILRARPLITIDTAEAVMSQTFALLLLIPLGIAIYRYRRQKPGPWSSQLLGASLLLLVLCFITPDKMASGGFISIRLMTTFFIFLALWLAYSLPRGKWISLALGLFIALNLWQVKYHLNKALELSADAGAFIQATAHLKEETTVLPLNYSYHWLHYNIGCYLGAEKNIVVLDNYEADKSHFPVQWNQGMAPEGRLGDFAYSKRPSLKLADYEAESGQQLDYVVLWGHQNDFADSATIATMSLLQTHFIPGFSSEDGRVKVFKRRPGS